MAHLKNGEPVPSTSGVKEEDPVPSTSSFKAEDPVPSTSSVKDNETGEKDARPQSDNEDDLLVLRSLDVIARTAAILKAEPDDFVAVLEKVLDLVEGDQTEKRRLKYNLVEKVVSNILDAETDELAAAKEHFEMIFSQRKFKDLLIREADIMRLPCTVQAGPFSFTFGTLSRNGSHKKVVMKKASSQHRDLIDREVAALSQLRHKNIVRLFGRHESEPELVLEIMDLGELNSAILHIHFTTDNLLKLLKDVAGGMEYVAAKKYLHRDLLCSNVFLNGKKQCKIGNFENAVYVGDSAGVYVEKVRDVDAYNLSPETLLTKTFTTANDVWAMGVLCWELFYNVEHSERLAKVQFQKKKHVAVLHGTNLPLPKCEQCPVALHRFIVNDVLIREPERRPSFAAIKEKIKEIASDKTS